MLKTIFVSFPQHSGDLNGSMGQYYITAISGLESAGYRVLPVIPSELVGIVESLGFPKLLATKLFKIARKLGGWMGVYLMFQFILRFKKICYPMLVISQEYVPMLYLSKSIVIVHDLIQAKYPRTRFVGWFYRGVIPWGLRRAHRVITISKVTQSILHELGVNSNLVYPLIEKKQLMNVGAKRVLLNGQPNVLWIGTAATHKDIQTLLKVAGTNAEFNFTVILPDRDRAIIAGNNSNVTILSSLTKEQMEIELLKASVFLSTSLAEGYGLPAMESRIAGIPLVLTDIPIYRELHSGAAIFFQPGDTEDLIRSLRLAVSPENPFLDKSYSMKMPFSTNGELIRAVIC